MASSVSAVHLEIGEQAQIQFLRDKHDNGMLAQSLPGAMCYHIFSLTQ